MGLNLGEGTRDRLGDHPLWGVGPWAPACLVERQVQRLREKRVLGGDHSLTVRPRRDLEGGCKARSATGKGRGAG